MDKFKECMHHQIGIGGMSCSCCVHIARKGHNHKDPELHRAARSRMSVNTRKKIEEGIEDWLDSQAVPEYWDTELNDWVSFETVTTLKWER